jgi:hypothetical protein
MIEGPIQLAGGSARVSATGLSQDVDEYRRRLSEQTDEQIDAWAGELMRDMSIRRGVLPVLEELRHATGLSDSGLERAYAIGGGAPATAGRTADGHLMVPAIGLRHFVPGLRRELPDARQRLIDYLALNFEELVYI